MMRALMLLLLSVSLVLPGWGALRADPGTAPERVSRASAVDPGHGVVVISVRSEIYLDEPLHVWFLREGGSAANPADVIRFERRQGFFAFGNNTVGYQVRSFQLPAGSYRLIAHGIDCPTIPAVEERCLTDLDVLGARRTFSRPSRGYGAIAPSFEVQAGSVTYAGDFALTARNTVEWSQIPPEELSRTRSRFSALPQGPGPIVPSEFVLRYGLNARSFEDDYRRQF